MPEWLEASENYEPERDQDAFINKSILGFLRILSKMRNQSGPLQAKNEINAEIKVACTFFLVIMISLTTNFAFLLTVGVYLLFLLSFQQGECIVKILKVSLAAGIFTFVIVLPSLFFGNLYSCIMIPSKVLPSVMAVNILSYSTRWSSITKALKTFFVSDIFIFVLEITIKYIVLLGELSLNMLYALKMRSIGKNRNKNTALSGIAGTMFLKSKEMAEEMYDAMQCRCYTGEYKVSRRIKFTFKDFLYVAVNLCMLVLFIYLGRL